MELQEDVGLQSGHGAAGGRRTAVGEWCCRRMQYCSWGVVLQWAKVLQ